MDALDLRVIFVRPYIPHFPLVAEEKLLLGILKESAPGETRVALLPESLKSLIAQGIVVTVKRARGYRQARPTRPISTPAQPSPRIEPPFSQAPI